MSTLIRYSIAFVIALAGFFTFTSCDNGPSLQKYMVEKQDDSAFMKIDLASSLLLSDNNNISVEDKEILNTIKKVNVVAMPIEEDKTESYETEKQKVKTILAVEKYKTLMKYGSNQNGADLKFLGDEDAIEEFVAFVSDENKGFAVVRITGKNMKPADIMRVIGNLGSGDLNMTALSGLGNMFGVPDMNKSGTKNSEEIEPDLESNELNNR